MIAALLAQFSTLFATARQEVRSGRREWLLLLLIIALGVFVRFWGLGAVGLHGDEKTMALPLRSLLEHGEPLMPSGMFYPRALGQLYLMAGSVMVFGETEWAMRVPSALCGVLLIVLAWFVGRRFLVPTWNLAFVAAVAFLPHFILDAQTARMYVFLVTCIAGFLVLLFAWERSDRPIFLIGAVLTLIVGLQFHLLAVFSAPLLLYPGLLRGDLRRLVAGIVAFAVVVAAFVGINVWIESHYPPPEQVPGFERPPRGPRGRWALPDLPIWLVALAVVAATALAAWVVRAVPRAAALLSGTLLVLGLAALTLFAWHAAALLMIAGLVIARRAGPIAASRVLVLAAVCAALALAQVFAIHSQGVSLRQTLGAVIGYPSIWPLIVVSGYSVAAALVVAAALSVATWRLAHREPVPDHVLFVVLGVWVPLIIMGIIQWHIPLRYAEGQVLPLLLAGFAAAQWLGGALSRASAPLAAPRAAAVASAVVCLLVVNPVLFARTVNAGYANHPDHKGAAEFMRSRELGPRDVIVAEDVLHHTYYLGHVDYLLSARPAVAFFVRNVDGVPKEIYVHAPIIGSGEELTALLDDPDRGAVYIIGSGEEMIDGRRHFRALGIQEVLDSERFEVVYHGRDGLTRIWKAPPPSLAARK